LLSLAAVATLGGVFAIGFKFDKAAGANAEAASSTAPS
jgi:hypothetical protein